MTSYRSLHEGWTVSGGDLSGVPAVIPGCVHTDLLAAEGAYARLYSAQFAQPVADV